MSTSLDTIKDFLLKARRRLHDENPDYSDVDEEQDPEGLDSEVGEGDDEDEASKWLADHDKGVESTSPEEAESEPDEEEERRTLTSLVNRGLSADRSRQSWLDRQRLLSRLRIQAFVMPSRC